MLVCVCFFSKQRWDLNMGCAHAKADLLLSCTDIHSMCLLDLNWQSHQHHHAPTKQLRRDRMCPLLTLLSGWEGFEEQKLVLEWSQPHTDHPQSPHCPSSAHRKITAPIRLPNCYTLWTVRYKDVYQSTKKLLYIVAERYDSFKKTTIHVKYFKDIYSFIWNT